MSHNASRSPKRRGTAGNVESPSLAEIRRRAAEVRKHWDDEEYQLRGRHFATSAGVRIVKATGRDLADDAWTVPVYHMEDVLRGES